MRDSAGWIRCWSDLELLLAVLAEDDQLPVEHVVAGRELELREVPSQRLAVARLDKGLVAVDECQRPKAVPFGFVGPFLALRQRRAGERKLRHDRGRERGHRPAS